MKKSYDSRTAEKFIIRLPPGKRDRLKEQAQAANQSMNDVAITAIDKHLEQGAAFDELLRIVQRAIDPQGGEFVTIKREYLKTLVRANNGDVPDSDPAMVAAIAVLGRDPRDAEE